METILYPVLKKELSQNTDKLSYGLLRRLNLKIAILTEANGLTYGFVLGCTISHRIAQPISDVIDNFFWHFMDIHTYIYEVTKLELMCYIEHVHSLMLSLTNQSVLSAYRK